MANCFWWSCKEKGRPLTDFSSHLSRHLYNLHCSRALEYTKNNHLFWVVVRAQLRLGRPCLGSPRWASLPPLLIHFTARCHFNCAWVAGERAGRAAAAAMMVESLHLVLRTASTARSNAAPCCRSDQNPIYQWRMMSGVKMAPVAWLC